MVAAVMPGAYSTILSTAAMSGGRSMATGSHSKLRSTVYRSSRLLIGGLRIAQDFLAEIRAEESGCVEIHFATDQTA